MDKIAKTKIKKHLDGTRFPDILINAQAHPKTEMRNRTCGSAIRAMELELDGDVHIYWFDPGATIMSIEENGVLVGAMHRNKPIFKWNADFLAEKNWTEDHANSLIEVDIGR